MNCRKARECIQLQLDGELPERGRQRLFRHIQTCDDCRSVQEQTAMLSSAFDELGSAAGSASSSRLVFTPSPHRRWSVPLSIAAAVALMIGAGTLCWQATARTWLAAADHYTVHLAQRPAGELSGPVVTRQLGVSGFGSIDPFTWIALAFIVLGIAILLVRLRLPSSGVFPVKVYQRAVRH